MEKKKKESKTSNKLTKKVTKKATKNVVSKTTINKDSKHKKGFTLIELLAVIIILGILMIIAIPSVTKYISDSRKSTYADTAKEIVAGTRNVVNEGKLDMFSTDTTYYIPAQYVKTENGLKSPYGEFTEAYVGITYDGKGYEYYWISTDDAGQGIPNITPLDKLEPEMVVSDLKDEDINNKVKTTGVGNRHYIKILNIDGTWKDTIYITDVANNISEGNGTTTTTVVYPTGKTKETVSTGEIVTIGSESFYVIDKNGDDLVLLARYNLKVGDIFDKNNNNNQLGSYSSSDPGYGRQSSEAKGGVTGEDKRGTMAFASTNYWNGQVGVAGSPFEGNYGEPYVYVYNGSSNLKQYVDSYASYLRSLGITIKEARLMKYIEAKNLGCSGDSESCAGAPAFMHETSFWLGNANGPESIWRVDAMYNKFMKGAYDNNYYFGVRPVIVI